jgi:hypothetical protein
MSGTLIFVATFIGLISCKCVNHRLVVSNNIHDFYPVVSIGYRKLIVGETSPFYSLREYRIMTSSYHINGSPLD